jgi:hypothetical protein
VSQKKNVNAAAKKKLELGRFEHDDCILMPAYFE